MKLLIHPGFHKTGTTFLQERVFCNESKFHSILTHAEVDEYLVAPHDLYFHSEDLQSLVAQRIGKTQSGAVPVLSSEILSGNPLVGSKDSVTLANRLHAVMPGSRIVFTVRRQQDLLISLYLQYVKRGGRLDHTRFFEHRTEPGYSWFDLSVVMYDGLVGRYADLFGKENVLVLPQEWLFADQEHFLSVLCDYAGTRFVPEMVAPGSSGKSPPASGIPLMRMGNLFRRTPLNPNAMTSLSFVGEGLQSLAFRQSIGEAKTKRGLKDYITTRFKGSFAASNRRLQAYTPADLAALGYEV